MEDMLCKRHIVTYDQTCPICYDKMLTKSTTFITDCGHCFHKKCLFNYLVHFWRENTYVLAPKCPMCRLSLGCPNFIEKCSEEKCNGLDKLEDFWTTYEYKMPIFCSFNYDHYLGMKLNCKICQAFRENGDYIYIM